MNKLESFNIVTPDGKTDECAKFTIENADSTFTLNKVASLNRDHVLRFWIKSDFTGAIDVLGEEISTSSKWFENINKFKATSDNIVITFKMTGVYYLYNSKLELGNTPSDWSPAPEDVETDIDELRKEYKAELKIEQDRITANVEATDALGSRVSKVEQTADGLEVSLSNLKFGGRNLLLKTGELLGSNFRADSSGSEAIGKVASQSDGSILITNTNTNTRILTNPIDVSLNTEYMISIDYKLVSGSHPFQIQTTEYEEDGITAVIHGAITSDKYTSTPIGGGWYRIVAPYRTSNNQKTKKSKNQKIQTMVSNWIRL